MASPSKDIRFLGKAYRLHGLAADDSYFASLHDDMELEFVRFCRSHVRPNYNCVDIGANIGLKALITASQACDGRVVAVEAGPTVAGILDLNVRTNGVRNIAVEQAAVADRIGTARFREESAYGALSNEGVEVPLTTLAALKEKHGLPRIDFVKIDVEGSEFQILKSALDLINQDETLVYFEFNAWGQIMNAQIDPREFAIWILQSFSHVYLVNKGGNYDNLLSRVAPGDWGRILQQNFFASSFVDDLVVTNAPWRLDSTAAQVNAAVAERDAALAAQQTAIAERDAAVSSMQALYNSRSWKLTAGLRWGGERLRSWARWPN